MATRKNLQLDDLGVDRRIEITTADDKRDPYARFTEKDLQALRKSVQDPQAAHLQGRDKKHLDAWSNFHQKVEMEEGVFTDEPQLMNGQSHRAHLHFDMRHKEGLVSKRVAPSRHVPASRTHHLDPALDPGKVSFGKPNPPGSAPGITRPASGKPKEGPRFDKHKGLKVQRRPVRPPTKPAISRVTQNHDVKLADPGSWLNTVRSQTGQPHASALPSTSQVETTSNTKSTESQPVATKTVVATKPVATTQAPAVVKPVVKIPTNATPKPTAATQPASITQTVATMSAVGSTMPAVVTQMNMTTTSSAATTTAKPASAVQPVLTPKPTGTPKPVPKLENPFFGSNLPQPQTNSSTPRAQPQPTKDTDLLLNFDSPPKKKGPEPVKSASEPGMMELDDDGDKADSDTAVASVLKKRLVWLDELGVINDTLADPDLTDIKVTRQLEERRKKVQDMIHAASHQKISKPQQMTPRPEKLIELSPTPLQKAVTAQPFVPLPKPTFGEVKAPLKAVKGGLQASRWAVADAEMANTCKESPKKTFKPKDTGKESNNNVDYWQKTLPKLPPLPADYKRTVQPPAPTPTAPPKTTKSIYDSRYAC